MTSPVTLSDINLLLRALDTVLAGHSKDADSKELKSHDKEKLTGSPLDFITATSKMLDDIGRRIFFFDEEETLLCASRKSLIWDAEVKLHALAQGLHIPGLSQMEYEATVYEVLPYVLNPEVSHIALRHLARTLSSDQANIFAFTFYSPVFTEHLVQCFVTASSYLDWSSLDEILSAVFAEDRWGFNGFTKPDIVDRIWSRALEQALRFCNNLPKTFHHLKQQVDVNRNMQAGTLRSLATYPTLLLRAAHAKHGERFDVLQFLGHQPRTLGAPCLAGLRKYLTSGPDVVLSEILRARETTSTGDDGYHFIDKVADGHSLRRLCRALTSFLASTDERVRSRAVFHVGFIAGLDHYCLSEMSYAMDSFPKGTSGLAVDAARHAVQEARKSPRRIIADADPASAWVYRHRSLDHGRTHVRHGLAFSRRHPCETCAALGIWDDWINGPDASCEALVANDRQLLWLYPEPGVPLGLKGHVPVHCGANEQGEAEFIGGAGVMHEDYFTPAFSRSATCTVTEGASRVEYQDAGSLRATRYFRVLVLRYDESEKADNAFGEEEVHFPGLDSTGPVYWRDVGIEDEDSDFSSGSEFDVDDFFSDAC